MTTQSTRRRLWKILFFISILFNIFTMISSLNQPDYKLGILKRDVNIADYNDDSKVVFKLPKGMTIVDVSPRGLPSIGLFNAERFSFTIVGSSSDFTEYSDLTNKSPFGGLYRLASKDRQVTKSD